MASIVSHNYFDQHASQQRQYLPPRPPPSPPMEETTRCSLPSISNLLDLADAGSPKPGTTTSSPRSSPRSDAYASPALMNKRREPPAALAPYGARPACQREGLPPTPPQSTDMSFDNPRSPHRSQFSLTGSQPRQYYSRTPPLESEASRRHAYAPIPETRPARHDYHPSPLQHQQLARDGYHAAPRGHPGAPPQHADGSGPNGWEHHHHYLHPSQMALFPQSQDRYICPTCHKAFSRPSSLRIHSHSHTGEKPFKCPHPGCGKAFSVRSNMKRHERGCHGVGAVEGTAPPSSYTWSANH